MTVDRPSLYLRSRTLVRSVLLLVVAGLLPVTACQQTTSRTPHAQPTSTDPPPSDMPHAPSEEGGQGNANVVRVQAVQGEDETWTFRVTVEHPDTGWEDYADGWDVMTPAGTVLKPDPDAPFTRLLLHPHVDEQPFTRTQSGIEIPPGVTQVRVRAHDLLDGYGGREVVVDLAKPFGPDFEVVRKGD